MYLSPTKKEALAAYQRFLDLYEAKYPKACECLQSYLGCALAHKACREGFRALYYYVPKLFRQLSLAEADGSLTRLLKKLARVDLLLMTTGD
jgi:hypothetical protein